MKVLIHENLSAKDRLTRITIGMGLAMTPLFFTDNVALIAATAFASFYPLMTALTAIDPLFLAMENIKWKPSEYKKSIPSFTA